MSIISNECLEIRSKSSGAELTSIFNKKRQIEHLWQANPNIWARHAPVLFPIVGKMQGKYQIQDEFYKLSQHGFARDVDFALIASSNSKLVYQLNSDESTLKKYPYKFSFFVDYSIVSNELSVTYRVINTDDKKIFFSVGAHPAFNVPFKENEQFEDYYLEFEKSETLNKYLITDGLLSGETALLLDKQSILPLSTSLFKDDALVLKEMSSRKITLRSKKNAHFIEMTFHDFPYFGIWTKPGFDAFVCLEPWCGIAETKGENVSFKQKEGIISLEKGDEFACTFQLKFG
jgi:galactose mutarotase-like enzyme